MNLMFLIFKKISMCVHARMRSRLRKDIDQTLHKYEIFLVTLFNPIYMHTLRRTLYVGVMCLYTVYVIV